MTVTEAPSGPGGTVSYREAWCSKYAQERDKWLRVVFIGGGMSGLVTCARLKEAGVNDVRIIEKGAGFGGTWYWNRYPGAQCDTASLVYMPSFNRPDTNRPNTFACHKQWRATGRFDGLEFR